LGGLKIALSVYASNASKAQGNGEVLRFGKLRNGNYSRLRGPISSVVFFIYFNAWLAVHFVKPLGTT